MPFDSTEFATRYAETEAFVPGPEGARRLARALRRQMPEGFSWDFATSWHNDNSTTECGTIGCALGLAHIKWPDEFGCPIGLDSAISEIAHKIHMPKDITWNIFGMASTYGCKFIEVTPTMVADAIDAWLVSVGERTSQEV